MTPGKKLAIAGIVIAGATGYMAYVGASASWQYYVTADECVANAASLRGDRIRVSGKVARDSLKIAPDRRQAAFSLAAAPHDLPVVCSGTLPDNLGENMEVVVEGRLDDSGLLRADKVLTRCAGKYKSQAPAVPTAAAQTATEGTE